MNKKNLRTGCHKIWTPCSSINLRATHATVFTLAKRSGTSLCALVSIWGRPFWLVIRVLTMRTLLLQWTSIAMVMITITLQALMSLRLLAMPATNSIYDWKNRFWSGWSNRPSSTFKRNQCHSVCLVGSGMIWFGTLLIDCCCLLLCMFFQWWWFIYVFYLVWAG